MKILVLEGDGIGPEVTAQAVRVLEAVAKHNDLTFELERAPFGGASLDDSGVPVTDATLKLATDADAVLLGAVGGPKWDHVEAALRPERGLLQLRSTMGVYANLRPAKIFHALADSSPLRRDLASQVDFLVVRELIGGIYFGEPRSMEGGVGFNTLRYSVEEIRRIGRRAFEIAQKREKRLCSIDKANVLEVMMLWRRTMTELSADYPDVELTHMYVDNAAMQVMLNPGQFDVMVTGNMFGDIISDESAAATGSIGLLPSASVGEASALYEPIHGSAPDIAGQNKANPLAAILSVAMLLEHTVGRRDLAAQVEQAVEAVLDEGLRTADLVRGDATAAPLGTVEMGEAVLAKLRG